MKLYKKFWDFIIAIIVIGFSCVQASEKKSISSYSSLGQSDELAEIDNFSSRTVNIASAHGAIAGLEIEGDFEQEFKSATTLLDSSERPQVGEKSNAGYGQGSVAVSTIHSFKQVFVGASNHTRTKILTLEDREKHDRVKRFYEESLRSEDFTEIEREAENGNPFARVCWSDGVLKGVIKGKSKTKAKNYIKKYSLFFEEYSDKSEFILLIRGILCEHDEKKKEDAKGFYFDAADYKYGAAHFRLGELLSEEKDWPGVIENYRSAADTGDPRAQNKLGLLYDEGNIILQDKEEAFKWYKLAADQEFVPAQFNLAMMYENGDGGPQDKEEAVRLYRLAAQRDDPRAQNRLGLLYDEGDGVPQSKEEAVRLYRLAAHQNLVSAQNNLGRMYDEGSGVHQDKGEAFRWYKLAADPGFASAQCNLGKMYHTGEGVVLDKGEAFRWYKLAADQKYARAQVKLGRMYHKGDGVPRDKEEAFKWYKLAADQKYAPAQFILGRMYYNGDGVPQNKEEAVRLYRLAAHQEDPQAIQILAQLEL